MWWGWFFFPRELQIKLLFFAEKSLVWFRSRFRDEAALKKFFIYYFFSPSPASPLMVKLELKGLPDRGCVCGAAKPGASGGS